MVVHSKEAGSSHFLGKVLGRVWKEHPGRQDGIAHAVGATDLDWVDQKAEADASKDLEEPFQ